MKPKDAKKLLGCSYTTLHNYVKAGKIKLSCACGKQQDYDRQSVIDLYNAKGSVCAGKLGNTIHMFINGEKYEFTLSDEIIEKVFNTISDKLKEELHK